MPPYPSRRPTEAGAKVHHPPPAPPAKIWLWCLSGGPKSLGFQFMGVLPAKRRFLEWRDPDSNWGHLMIFRHVQESG